MESQFAHEKIKEDILLQREFCMKKYFFIQHILSSFFVIWHYVVEYMNVGTILHMMLCSYTCVILYEIQFEYSKFNSFLKTAEKYVPGKIADKKSVKIYIHSLMGNVIRYSLYTLSCLIINIFYNYNTIRDFIEFKVKLDSKLIFLTEVLYFLQFLYICYLIYILFDLHRYYKDILYEK